MGRFWRAGVTIKDLPPTIFVLFLALELLLAANPQYGAPEILYVHKKHLQSDCVDTSTGIKGGKNQWTLQLQPKLKDYRLQK